MSRPILPILAIVGRPNVGKSRLFNRYAGQTRALVRDQPGVTRDRIAQEITVGGRRVMLVDTAGLDREGEDDLERRVQAQAQAAVLEADAILFVVDGRAGLLPEDEEIARTLRRTEQPMVLAVNKIDAPDQLDRIHEFYRLGFESVHGISAEHGGGAFDALEELVARLPEAPLDDEEQEDEEHLGIPHGLLGDEIPDFSEEPLSGHFGAPNEPLAPDDDGSFVDDASPVAPDDEPREMRIAVVGRPNVGKSSLVNRLLGEERVVVSNVPGTTRDAIDIRLEVDGRSFVLVDTAGLRRPGRRERGVERASALMTVRSLQQADVALLLIDASEGFTDMDAHVASMVRDEGCAAVVLANKWDRVDAERGEDVLEGIGHGLRFMSDVPVLTISALTGGRVARLFPAIERVYRQATKKVSTPELNRWLQETVRRHEPKLAKRANQVRRPMKFFYAVQSRTRPPTFVLFCTQPESIQTSYRRYLENRLREQFGFAGTPIRLRLRSRKRK